MLRPWALSAVFSLTAFGATPTTTPIDSAVNRMYDFDFAGSHEILNRYIAAHPQEPLPYAFRASAYLFYELDRLGILESEFLIDDKKIAEKKKKVEPDPVNREKFMKTLTDVDSRVDAALKVNPDDRKALLAVCIAQGVATDYMAFVEKKQFSSLTLAKRSNTYAQRLLKLEPTSYDPYLTTGISEYMLGSLPFFVRWFVHFDNVEGNKKTGIERLQLVAREGHYFKPFAKILLSIISLREKRPLDAHRWLVELARDYPDNPLFRKELVKLSAKLGLNAN